VPSLSGMGMLCSSRNTLLDLVEYNGFDRGLGFGHRSVDETSATYQSGVLPR
jgi:hypothetical protein